MTPRRPTECPACGHERINRRAAALLHDGSSARLWICHLCEYIWRDRTRTRVDQREIV